MSIATTNHRESGLTLRAGISDAIEQIEAIANECSLSALDQQGAFTRAFTMAAGIRALKGAISGPVLQDLMDLQGSKLGFRTDKDREGGYKPDIVKECAIEAALRGARWVGNEFNIIASSCYLTKEFFVRTLREFKGLTNLRLDFGAPVMREAEKRAWVSCRASWVLYGTPDFIEKTTHPIEGSDKMLDERIVVKLNGGMSEDAVLGKAERKIRALIYSRITGSEVFDGEVDDAGLPRQQLKKLSDLSARLAESSSGESQDGDESGSDQTSPEPVEVHPDVIEALNICTTLKQVNDTLEVALTRNAPTEAHRKAINDRADEAKARVRAAKK